MLKILSQATIRAGSSGEGLSPEALRHANAPSKQGAMNAFL